MSITGPVCIVGTMRVAVQRAVERDEIPNRDAASPIKYNGLCVPQTSSLSHCVQPAVPYRNIMD